MWGLSLTKKGVVVCGTTSSNWIVNFYNAVRRDKDGIRPQGGMLYVIFLEMAQP